MGRQREIERLLNRIEAALVVRDPGTAVSADAYDGLRKIILQSAKNRRIHIAHLLSLSDSLKRGASLQALQDRVSDYMEELGIAYWDDVSQSDFFEISDGEGSSLECVEPAVIEKLEDGRVTVVRLGKALRVPDPIVDPGDLVARELPDGGATPESDVADIPGALDVHDGPQMTRSGLITAGVVIALISFLLGILVSSGSKDSSPSKTKSQFETTSTAIIESTTSTVISPTTTAEVRK